MSYDTFLRNWNLLIKKETAISRNDAYDTTTSATAYTASNGGTAQQERRQKLQTENTLKKEASREQDEASDTSDASDSSKATTDDDEDEDDDDDKSTVSHDTMTSGVSMKSTIDRIDDARRRAAIKRVRRDATQSEQDKHLVSKKSLQRTIASLLRLHDDHRKALSRLEATVVAQSKHISKLRQRHSGRRGGVQQQHRQQAPLPPPPFYNT